jgi:hypothetical protein
MNMFQRRSKLSCPHSKSKATVSLADRIQTTSPTLKSILGNRLYTSFIFSAAVCMCGHIGSLQLYRLSCVTCTVRHFSTNTHVPRHNSVHYGNRIYCLRAKSSWLRSLKEKRRGRGWGGGFITHSHSAYSYYKHIVLKQSTLVQCIVVQGWMHALWEYRLAHPTPCWLLVARAQYLGKPTPLPADFLWRGHSTLESPPHSQLTSYDAHTEPWKVHT